MANAESFRDRLIFALDVASRKEAERFVDELSGAVNFFKVGIILHTAAGRDFVSWLIKQGKKVFLDLKFFDIADTVRDAVGCAADAGVDFLTVHAQKEVMEAAVEGKKNSKLKILAVTLLTSLNAAGAEGSNAGQKTRELVLSRAKMAQEAGCDGVITSGKEISAIKRIAGGGFLIVTPGIRPAGVSTGGHKRISTPYEAVRAGADYLVVGRPIRNASDPRSAAFEILKEMEKAFALKG